MRTAVGILFNGMLDEFFIQHPDSVDFVSVIPDRFWVDFGRGTAPRFKTLPDELDIINDLATRYPLVAHGVGLSIASACMFDVEHLRQLKEWHERYQFGWISEHLACVKVRTDIALDHHAGLSIPLAWDRELLQMLVERISVAQEILGRPLLLENGVVHTPVPESEMTEVEFLNELCRRSGCGLLLDLHNLHVNVVNLGWDGFAFLDGLDLSTVGEIHIAGGNRLYGTYLDSHSGPCPSGVWSLLEKVAPRCANLAGITFEFHESYYPGLGVSGILAQLEQARRCVSPVAA